MTIPVIKVEGLAKEYVLGALRQPASTFYDLLSGWIRHPFGETSPRVIEPAPDSRFLALDDVSFDVNAGEVVGIIGRNGAGKSTLLKILSRITAPSRGRATVRGRLSSLLEVGTGFHAELSGRENIFLNGAILGMSRREISRKFDEIVAFAEVEKFIDTPVKRYSSGMYVRLAFGVAAHLDADILVIDEVLAVGDSAFQDKCMAKMGDLSQGGRTVIFVSHNHSAIARLCNRGIVLNRGRVSYDGRVGDALVNYNQASQKETSVAAATIAGPLTGVIEFEAMYVNDSSQLLGNVVKPEQTIALRADGKLCAAVSSFRVTFCIYKRGELIFTLHDLREPRDASAGRFEARTEIPAFLLSPGEYVLDVGAYSTETGEWMLAKNIGHFSVTNDWYDNYETNHAMGVVNLNHFGSRSEWP